MPPTPSPRRSVRWCDRLADRPAYLLLGTMALLLLLINPNWKVDPDSISYLSMARSLGTGHGLLRFGLHQWYYALLYSVYISPAFWFAGSPFLRISILNVATAWAIVLGSYFWFARYSRSGAGFVAALVGVNIGLWDVCREPRAETLFSALLIWAAVFMAKAADTRCTKRFVIFSFLSTLLVIAACWTREVGIFLCAGFTLAIAIRWARKRASFKRVVVSLLVGMVTTSGVLLLIVRDRHAAKLDHAAGAATYLEQYRQPDTSFTAQVIDGFRRQTADVGRLLIPGMWGSFAHQGQWLNVTTILYVLFTIPIAIGWWRLTRATADPLLWTVPFYAAMFVVWPFDQGTRFNVPMLPVLWAAAWMICRRWRSNRNLIFAIVLCLHVGVSAAYLLRDAKIVGKRNQSLPELTQLNQSIINHGGVAMLDLPENDSGMEKYLLDRPVGFLPKKDLAVPKNVHWLFTPAKAMPPVEFVPVAAASNIKLCRRVLP